MKITYWSDFACPYCYIGNTRLKKAIKDLNIEYEVEFDIHAFELDQNAPKDVESTTVDRFAIKYGLSINDAKKEAEINVNEERALYWLNPCGERILIFNAKIPAVNKNVDLCLFSGSLNDFNNIVHQNDKAIMFGELKGGIDPAGADEHWKTGNSALNRIRTKFSEIGFPQIKTSFVAAAIERAMAEEIFLQLNDGTLTNAANLTKDDQLTEFCNWLLDL